MLENRSIICFAHDWGGDPTSKTHIMRILSEKNRILWVNSIGMRRPTASGRDLRRLVMKLRRSLEGCSRVHGNLYTCNPLILPFPGVPGVDALNTWVLSAFLRRLIRRLGFHRPILWTFLPNVNGLLGRLGEDMVVYHCVDEYTAFSGVASQSLRQMEHDLLGKADLVFASSEQLCLERKSLNPRTYFISHGVDVGHFSRALDPRTKTPVDMQEMTRPVIGFFGLIAEWIDLSLIRYLALARPRWSIALVGKATTDLSPIKGLPNVHLLGQKPYGSLPGYCKVFDVAMVPFRINDLTVRANPLKLREYLAAGLPVVSTDLPEIRKYQHLVRIADGPEAFLHGVELSLGEQADSLRQRRSESMKSESWEQRVRELSSIITAVKDRTVSIQEA